MGDVGIVDVENQVQIKTDTVVSTKVVMRAIIDYADADRFDLSLVQKEALKLKDY